MVEMDSLARQLRDSLAGVLQADPQLIEDAMLTAIEHPNRAVRVAIRSGDDLVLRFGRRRRLTKGKFWTVSMTVAK